MMQLPHDDFAGLLEAEGLQNPYPMHQLREWRRHRRGAKLPTAGIVPGFNHNLFVKEGGQIDKALRCPNTRDRRTVPNNEAEDTLADAE